jgi:hypothetical protein
MRVIYLSAAFILITCSNANADTLSRDFSPPNLDGPGTAMINHWGISNITVESRTSDTGFYGESYVLKVYRKNHIIEFPFDTTYGNFRMWIANLTGADSPEIILVTSWGRGTSASAKFLDIYYLQDLHLVNAYEMLISEYFGPGDLWSYDVNLVRRQSTEDFITLTLAVEEPYHGNLVVQSLVPKEKIMYIVWNKKLHKFISRGMQPSS